jgi:hypothetical protein
MPALWIEAMDGAPARTEMHILLIGDRRPDLAASLDHLVGAGETNAVAGLLPMTRRRYAEQDVIVRQGDAPAAIYLLVDGCVFRYDVVASGKRQIMALHVPGALLNLQNLFRASSAATHHVRSSEGHEDGVDIPVFGMSPFAHSILRNQLRSFHRSVPQKNEFRAFPRERRKLRLSETCRRVTFVYRCSL